jgi:dihydroorotase
VVVRPLEAALARGGVAHEGVLSFALGLRGIPRAAETVAVQRDVTLAEAFGGRVHFAALSAREAVAAVRGPATAGTTAYHLLLTEDAVRGYDTRAKLDPPLREEADRAALVEAVRRRRLVVASGHRPCREEAKLCEYDYAEFGASALEVALAAALEVLEPPEFAWAVAAGPAEAFGLPGGTLRPGAPADVSVFDPEARWVVEPEAFVSRGRSTPLGGRALRARPVLTVVGGRVVFEAEKECINMQSK